MTSSDHEKKKEKKKTQGKLKIEIKKIEKSSSRHVTFSKRRTGLFKKASELSVSTGAEVGILVQSIGGKNIFSYGNPDVNSVIDRYEKNYSPSLRLSNDTTTTTRLKKDEESEPIGKDLVAEKEKKGIDDGNFWWNMDVKDLDYEELQKHLAALELLKENVIKRTDHMMKLEGQSKSFQSSDSTSTATSISNGVDCGLDHHHHQPAYVDRSVAGNSSNAPSIGSVIDHVAAVDDVSATHEELDLELRL